MAIKFKARSKAEIPAESQSLYVEREGAFVLDVDGAVEKSRLEEFRAKNIALNNQLGEHKKQFEGIHPDEARRLFEKQALQAGEIEKVVEGRLRAARRGSVIRLALSIAGDNPGEP